MRDGRFYNEVNQSPWKNEPKNDTSMINRKNYNNYLKREWTLPGDLRKTSRCVVINDKIYGILYILLIEIESYANHLTFSPKISHGVIA